MKKPPAIHGRQRLERFTSRRYSKGKPVTKPTATVARGQERTTRINHRSTPQRGSRTRRPAKRTTKKALRPKVDESEARFTIPRFAMEHDGPDGPRLDLAFLSLPLWKGGAR